jgi:hypothetical protein
MNESKPSGQFWLGNAVLALAFLLLLFMGQLWAVMGIGAMVLWGLLVAAGVYLLMQDKSEPPTFPG